MYVSERFGALLANVKLTDDQKNDGTTKHKGVRNCLNREYYNLSSDYANSILVGSWGKETRVRPPRDIDVLFVLPDDVYWRFQRRSGNKQSQLLQEVKPTFRIIPPALSCDFVGHQAVTGVRRRRYRRPGVPGLDRPHPVIRHGMCAAP